MVDTSRKRLGDANLVLEPILARIPRTTVPFLPDSWKPKSRDDTQTGPGGNVSSMLEGRSQMDCCLPVHPRAHGGRCLWETRRDSNSLCMLGVEREGAGHSLDISFGVAGVAKVKSEMA